jgi:antitoxin VapB
VAINIKDAETERVIRELAAVTGESITEAVRRAAEAMIAARAAEREAERARRHDTNRQILDELRRLKATKPISIAGLRKKLETAR